MIFAYEKIFFPFFIHRVHKLNKILSFISSYLYFYFILTKIADNLRIIYSVNPFFPVLILHVNLI